MEQRPQSNPGNTPGRTPFQFGVRSLLVLTAACAVVLSAANSIQAPVMVRLAIAVYFMLWAAYAVLRVPHLYRRANALDARWKDGRQRRRELEALVEQAKADRAKDRE